MRTKRRPQILLLTVLLAGCGSEVHDDFDPATEGLALDSNQAAEPLEALEVSCAPPEPFQGPTASRYVGNPSGGLCLISSEVNTKVALGWISGGPPAEALRDCIAGLLSTRSAPNGRACYTPGLGANSAPACLQEMALCEVLCGGPAVSISRL